jgi:hypothetical protein
VADWEAAWEEEATDWEVEKVVDSVAEAETVADWAKDWEAGWAAEATAWEEEEKVVDSVAEAEAVKAEAGKGVAATAVTEGSRLSCSAPAPQHSTALPICT